MHCVCHFSKFTLLRATFPVSFAHFDSQRYTILLHCHQKMNDQSVISPLTFKPQCDKQWWHARHTGPTFGFSCHGMSKAKNLCQTQCGSYIKCTAMFLAFLQFSHGYGHVCTKRIHTEKLHTISAHRFTQANTENCIYLFPYIVTFYLWARVVRISAFLQQHHP